MIMYSTVGVSNRLQLSALITTHITPYDSLTMALCQQNVLYEKLIRNYDKLKSCFSVIVDATSCDAEVELVSPLSVHMPTLFLHSLSLSIYSTLL